MPRYRNEAGVVVNVSEELARLVGGLTPIDQPTAPADTDVAAWLAAEQDAWLAAEQAWLATPEATAAWLAAEAEYNADVTAWLDAETAAANPATTAKPATARGRK